MGDFGRRFDIFLEPHIGFGIRWDNWVYPIHLGISIMCVTITIGIGKRKVYDLTDEERAE